jgi:DNA-binding transcriptional LysR family regulator
MPQRCVVAAFANFTAMEARGRRILFSIVAAHVLLLAFYTLPQRIMPERMRVIGQFYARGLFHQQWRLFAPDPPLCDCEVQAVLEDGSWRPLVRPEDGCLDRRMAQSIARNLQRSIAAGHAPDGPTLQAMRAMVRDISREQPGLRFQLVERCVRSAERPDARELRITQVEAR